MAHNFRYYRTREYPRSSSVNTLGTLQYSQSSTVGTPGVRGVLGAAYKPDTRGCHGCTYGTPQSFLETSDLATIDRPNIFVILTAFVATTSLHEFTIFTGIDRVADHVILALVAGDGCDEVSE